MEESTTTSRSWLLFSKREGISACWCQSGCTWGTCTPRQKAISLFAKFEPWVPDVLGIESCCLVCQGLYEKSWWCQKSTDNARAEALGGAAGKPCCIQLPLLKFLVLLLLDFHVQSWPGCSSNARQTAVQLLLSQKELNPGEKGHGSLTVTHLSWWKG